MSEWHCVECGGSMVTGVQPSTDSTGNTATGLCASCSPWGKDKDGYMRRHHRVGLTREAFTPVPPPRRQSRASERQPESLWTRKADR